MFDAHCHLDQTAQPDQVLARALTAGLKGLMVAGVAPDDWENQLGLNHPAVTHALGVHPWCVRPTDERWDDRLNKLLSRHPDRVLAVGETGLDFGGRTPPEHRQAQERAFRIHLALARDHELPVVLHVVSAHEQVIRILEEHGRLAAGGMVHGFGGSAEVATRYLRLGLHISFGGAVTDVRRAKARAAAAAVPRDRILVESDAPDQTPIRRRPAPNEPAFLIDVVNALAEIRGDTPEGVGQQTYQNARELFGIQ